MQKPNILETQTAVFEYDGLNVMWQQSTWGTSPDPKYPWALMRYGDKGTLKASTLSYDFIPQGQGEAIHKECVYERERRGSDQAPAASLSRAVVASGTERVILWSAGPPAAHVAAT